MNFFAAKILIFLSAVCSTTGGGLGRLLAAGAIAAAKENGDEFFWIIFGGVVGGILGLCFLGFLCSLCCAKCPDGIYAESNNHRDTESINHDETIYI